VKTALTQDFLSPELGGGAFCLSFWTFFFQLSPFPHTPSGFPSFGSLPSLHIPFFLVPFTVGDGRRGPRSALPVKRFGGPPPCLIIFTWFPVPIFFVAYSSLSCWCSHENSSTFPIRFTLPPPLQQVGKPGSPMNPTGISSFVRTVVAVFRFFFFFYPFPF